MVVGGETIFDLGSRFFAGCAGRFDCRALVLVIGYLGQLLRASVGLADRTRFPVDID